MIDHYFRFEKLDNTKSKTRFDLTACTKPVYEPIFKTNKKGQCFIYYSNTPEHIQARQKRKTDMSLTVIKDYLTGIHFPEVSRRDMALGDVHNRPDSLLILFSMNCIEICVVKGGFSQSKMLFNLLYDGELDSEIESMRNQAVKTAA